MKRRIMENKRSLRGRRMLSERKRTEFDFIQNKDEFMKGKNYYTIVWEYYDYNGDDGYFIFSSNSTNKNTIGQEFANAFIKYIDDSWGDEGDYNITTSDDGMFSELLFDKFPKLEDELDEKDLELEDEVESNPKVKKYVDKVFYKCGESDYYLPKDALKITNVPFEKIEKLVKKEFNESRKLSKRVVESRRSLREHRGADDYTKAFRDGYKQGYEDGYEDGYDDGFAGINESKETPMRKKKL